MLIASTGYSIKVIAIVIVEFGEAVKPRHKYSFVKIHCEFDETGQVQTVNCGGLLNTTATFPVLATCS